MRHVPFPMGLNLKGRCARWDGLHRNAAGCSPATASGAAACAPPIAIHSAGLAAHRYRQRRAVVTGLPCATVELLLDFVVGSGCNRIPADGIGAVVAVSRYRYHRSCRGGGCADLGDQTSVQIDIFDTVGFAIIVLTTQYPILPVHRDDVALARTPGNHTAAVTIVSIGFLAYGIAQTIAIIELESLAIFVGKVALHVVCKAHDSGAGIIDDVAQAIDGVIPVVVLLYAGKLGGAQVVQRIVAVGDLPATTKRG